MKHRIRAVISILILSSSFVFSAIEPKQYNIYLDFEQAAYTEFGFSGGPVTDSNNTVTAIDSSGIEIETARTDTEAGSDKPGALHPGDKIVYAYWNIVSVNGVDVYIRIDEPLLPRNWISETQSQIQDAPSIDWSVKWQDADYTTGSVSSNGTKRSLLASMGKDNPQIIDSIRLTISASSITEISKYVADVYSSSLILEVEAK